MSNDVYTLVVSDTPFVFTEEQLASEPDNKLAAILHGARTRELLAEPAIFKLVQVHLRGYEIFPLPDAAIPYYMKKDTMIANLLFEAERWQLKHLAAKIKEYRNFDIKPKESFKKTFKLSVSDILSAAFGSPLFTDSVLNFL
jgi:hypothetical protein